MVKTDFLYTERKWYALSVFLIFAFSLLSYVESQAQSIACNNNVQVSLNKDCEADITPAMILEGEDESNLPNFSVSIAGVSGTIVTQTGVYEVTVTDATTGNSCWGTITVEDKLAPFIEACDCPVGNTDPACQFFCTDLDGILSNSISVPQPVVNENCSSYVAEYSDIVSDGGCGEKIITRSWLFTDGSGNEAEGCIQEFRALPVGAGDIVPPVSPIIMTCGSDVSMPGIVEFFTPSVGANTALTYGYPTVNGSALSGAICNLVATKEDVVIPACDQSCSNSIKVLRDWTILDWCTAEVTTFNQIIKAVDEEEPTISADDQTVSVDPWVCEGNFFLEAPGILHDNCTDYVTYTVTGPAGVTITWNPQANLYFATGAPKGEHTFNYIASDCCGNQGTDQVTVTVVDQTAPVAIAKQNVVVSLTQSANGNGVAKVYANSIDNESHDGCTAVHLEIRRDSDVCDVAGNTTYNNDSHSFDSFNDIDNGQWVKFCCEDLTNATVDVDGDGVNDAGYVKVWLRVWDDGDMNGQFGTSGDNFNETWSFVKVEDKLNPILHCPADITIACDADAEDLSVTGTATASFTCADAEVEYTDIFSNVDNCGVGIITRRWSIVGSPNVSCNQRITKSAGDLFDGNISWPGDYDTDCTDLDNDNNVPTWGSVGCSLVGYSIESDTFLFEDGACFKIINYWTVIDWCQYDPNANGNDGIWSHAQIIKVIDDEAPVMTCANQMYAVDDHTDADNDGNQCEARSLMLTNTADDNGDCASEWLKWTVLVDLWGDGTYDYEFSSHLPIFDTNFNDSNGNGIPDRYLAPTSSGEEVKVTLPEDIAGSMNNHKVKWSVSDGCNNVTSCENTFMVVDKKAPTPYCIDISTALMENGMVELWACDFDLGSFDNCTSEENLRFTFTETKPQNDPNFNNVSNCSSRVFDCDDLENSPVMVQMYVWDEKDNFDFCEVMLSLVDNQGGCDAGNGIRIAGKITSPSSTSVEEIEVTLISSEIDMIKYDMTNTDGAFAFGNNPNEVNYHLSASNDEDYLNGVSTLDLVLIQRHILGLASLDNAYKVIAADINNDEKLTASDLLQLRKLILGVVVELPDNDSYNFVNAEQTFDDINQPWPVQTQITINDLDHDMEDQNFVAIKVGDVNGNASYNNLATEEATTRSNQTLQLSSTYSGGSLGEKGSFSILSESNEDLYGLQMVLDVNGLSNVTLKSGMLTIDESNFKVEGNSVKISWSSSNAVELKSGQSLFTIEGVAIDASSSNITVDVASNHSLKSEGYINNLKVADIELSTRSEREIVFAVTQNEPNPFKESTQIAYSIPVDGEVTLTVMDITGKIVMTSSKQSTKEGYFTILESDLNGSGIYYYSIASGESVITKKMILIK